MSAENTETVVRLPARLQAVCSVCLGTFQLRRGNHRPVRHGFTAHGVHHGQSGGFHTDPCPGVSWPNFGISADGTRWALDQATKHLAHVHASIEAHQARPVLHWTRPLSFRDRRIKDQGGRVEHVAREVAPGTPADYHVGCPSYDQLWRQRDVMLRDDADATGRQIAAYEAAIASWEPRDPVPLPAPAQVVHRARDYVVAGGGTFEGPSCRRVRPMMAQTYALTRDPARVTCSRCGGGRGEA